MTVGQAVCACLDRLGECNLQLLVDLVAGGRLSATLGYTADWSRLSNAIAAFRERRFSGKAVLTIN